MTLAFRLRTVSLLATAAFGMVREDPAGFAAKLAERARTSESPLLARLPTGMLTRFVPQASSARSLIDAGNLSEGIRAVEDQARPSRSDRHLADRTWERLAQLHQQPAKSAPIMSSSNRRVLHVLTNSLPYTNSGYTLRSHSVLRAQQEVGIDVRAVTRLGYPVLVGKLPCSMTQTVDDITYERLVPATYPSSLLQRDELATQMLVKRARELGATILHTTTDFKNALVVSHAAQELEIPWVYEIRGELESTWLSKQPAQLQDEAARSEFYRLAREQETASAKAASAVVTLSEIVKEQFIARGVDSHKIHVIPNAIDEKHLELDVDRTSVRTELGLPSARLVGTVTSVVDYEGLETLLRAIEHLPGDVGVLIVGEGTARPELEELARELGFADRVHFAGRQPQEDIWKWYSALDVFVVPRRDLEVCRVVTPIKALMAQALGLPVVASDLPALREVTGERARFVVPEDPPALAEGITESLENETAGRSDLEWLRSRTWQANAQRYRDLYDQL